MKLAQALMDRSDMQDKLMAIETRIHNNLRVQEGQELIEDPNALIKDYEKINERLTELIQKINKTNNTTILDGYDMTLADALAKKDRLLALKNLYENVVSSATNYQTRISRTEIKYVNVVDVKKIQKMSDDLSKEYRLLDAKIQEVNWLTELQNI